MAERTASLVKFLGFDAYIATNAEALLILIAELPKTMALLVASDENYQLLASSLQVSRDSCLQCACFLMERKDVTPLSSPARISTTS